VLARGVWHRRLTRLRALIQQISSGLYWKTGTGWVKEREAAEEFGSSNAAVLFCVATEMRDTRVILNFGDPKLDIVLHPFGEQGHQRSGQEVIAQSHASKEKSRSLVSRVKAVLQARFKRLRP
jgi:hypothetical protein